MAINPCRNNLCVAEVAVRLVEMFIICISHKLVNFIGECFFLFIIAPLQDATIDHSISVKLYPPNTTL